MSVLCLPTLYLLHVSLGHPTFLLPYIEAVHGNDLSPVISKVNYVKHHHLRLHSGRRSTATDRRK